jgi:RimJ/RimL family protein N-acetyltransferase
VTIDEHPPPPPWWASRRFPVRWAGRYGFEVCRTERHRVVRAGARHRGRWHQMAADPLTRYYLTFPRYLVVHGRHRHGWVDELDLAVEALDTGRLVAGVRAFPSDDADHPGLELHWAVHPSHRGAGILSDVLVDIVDWLVEQGGPLTHVQARTCDDNVRSAHLGRTVLGDLGAAGTEPCRVHAHDTDQRCSGRGHLWCTCGSRPG